MEINDTEEDVFNNDIDPLEGIRQLRKEESSEVHKEPETEIEISEELEYEETAEEKEEASEEKNTSEEQYDAEVSEELESDDEKEELESKSEESASLSLKEKRKFKANGQEFEFTVQEMIDQFGVVFGKSVDYTQKTQKLAPHRKRISAMEDENITDEQFNLMIDAFKGNKGAIKKIMESHNLESYDLSDDDNEQTPYVPTQYGSDEATLNLKEVVNSIAADPEYRTTEDVVRNQWDVNSQNKLAGNPNLLQGLHNDVKSGTYALVAPEAIKLKILDGNTKSDIEYYMLAGQQLSQKRNSDNSEENVSKLNEKTQAAVTSADRASSEAKRKRSASSTGSRSDRTVIDYLDDDNDEAFDDWYKKVTTSQ